jgi:hypothetical protein
MYADGRHRGYLRHEAHSSEDRAVSVADITLKECDAFEWMTRNGIKPAADWLAKHPDWTSERETKECAANRAYIKQRWGHE